MESRILFIVLTPPFLSLAAVVTKLCYPAAFSIWPSLPYLLFLALTGYSYTERDRVASSNHHSKTRGMLTRYPGPGCSNSHIPGFMSHPKISSAGPVFVVAVNDPFVTKAWGEKLDPEGKSGVSPLTPLHFLSSPRRSQ